VAPGNEVERKCAVFNRTRLSSDATSFPFWVNAT
jgi:hypothetical protein